MGSRETIRALWHGIGPWHKTAYGLLTGLFAPLIRDLGHEVAIAVMGIKGDRRRDPLEHPDAAGAKRTGYWDGMRVIGPGLTEFGLPSPIEVRGAFDGHDPDLIIVLKDAWVLSPHAYERYPGKVLVWTNIDCEPMGAHDRRFFETSGATPVAVSLAGLSAMRKAGLGNARYIPHGINTAFWTPGNKEWARELLDLPHDAYIAGIDAANIGPRKGWGEQLAAFAAFRARKRKDALLLIHTAPEHPEGIDLRDLARHLGLGTWNERGEADPGNAVRFGSHGNMSDQQMLSWYRSLDVLMQGSYGEGFGMPVVQALACGIPVIGTDCTAISEKIPPGCGSLVGGQRWWNPHHQAWWTIPGVPALTRALGKRYAAPDLIRESAMQYDAGLITKQYWAPMIEELCD